MIWAAYIAIVVAAYLLGSIPTGYLVGRAKGVDIRRMGSGNIGATNVFRALGKVAGILVLGMDALKGYAACRWVAPWVGAWLAAPGSSDSATWHNQAIVAGLAAILGHTFTCWLQFKGGKGIATTGGAFGALAPAAVLTTLGIWIFVLAATRYVSAASLTAAVVLPITVWLWGGSPLLVLITVLIGLLAIYKHKANLKRLLAGTENRIASAKPRA